MKNRNFRDCKCSRCVAPHLSHFGAHYCYLETAIAEAFAAVHGEVFESAVRARFERLFLDGVGCGKTIAQYEKQDRALAALTEDVDGG